MMSLWVASVLIAAIGVLLPGFANAKPEGYGEFDHNHLHGHGHGHGYAEVPVVKKVVDYYSKPQYAFGYEVDDYYNQLSHGRWEIRDGDVTQGQYRVLLPDGRIQIVSYIADKGGYRPTVQYIGKGVHPPPPPAYANIKPPKHLHVEPEIIPHNDIGAYGGQIPLAAPIPAPVPVKEVVPVLPVQLPVYQDGPIGPSAYGHGGGYGYGQGYPATGYGHAFGYGGGYAAEPLIFGPSNQNQKIVKISPGRLAKKRALLYDRTLFRRDIPSPKPKVVRKE
jgi:hypothetical protein